MKAHECYKVVRVELDGSLSSTIQGVYALKYYLGKVTRAYGNMGLFAFKDYPSAQNFANKIEMDLYVLLNRDIAGITLGNYYRVFKANGYSRIAVPNRGRNLTTGPLAILGLEPIWNKAMVKVYMRELRKDKGIENYLFKYPKGTICFRQIELIEQVFPK